MKEGVAKDGKGFGRWLFIDVDLRLYDNEYRRPKKRI